MFLAVCLLCRHFVCLFTIWRLFLCFSYKLSSSKFYPLKTKEKPAYPHGQTGKNDYLHKTKIINKNLKQIKSITTNLNIQRKESVRASYEDEIENVTHPYLPDCLIIKTNTIVPTSVSEAETHTSAEVRVSLFVV